MITTVLLASDDLFGTVSQLSVDGTSALKAAAGLAILGFTLYRTFAGGFTIAKLVMAALVGALASWLIVSSGIFTVQDRVGNQITNASVVQTVQPVHGQATWL